MANLQFEVIKWQGKPRIVPSEALNLPGRPGDRSFMYRGQIEKYPTCLPSSFRNCLDNELQFKATLALERFRVSELELLLRDHPFKQVAESYGYWIDYHALAQHYGIPTSLLDVTSNVEIAAFFAVARWNKIQQRFEPMETGTGVVFRLDWSAFGTGYSRFFEPVGFGPGLRPARQHAWTFRLRPVSDFQNVPHVVEFPFTHLKEASAALFAKFNDGLWLYPPDCLASLV